MMEYAGTPASKSQCEANILSGVAATCDAAQRFFQQLAERATDSNLRYHFLGLSTLHQNAARQLPAPASAAQTQHYSNDLAAVQFWYLHQQVTLHHQSLQPALLSELMGLLQQQLTALKQLTRAAKQQQTKITLAHLSAALQIATDRLLPLLQVLPVNTQKVQTNN